MGLTIVRLFIHPVIWSAVMMLFRQFMLHSGETLALTCRVERAESLGTDGAMLSLRV